MIENIYKILSVVNFKTFYFNFKYLPFNQAVKLPFLVSGNVYLKRTRGKVYLSGPLYPGMIKIGLGDVGIFDKKKSRTIWNVSGNVIFKGPANLGHGTKISVEEKASLTLGNNFRITAETAIVCAHEIIIGDDCLFSWDTLIMDTDFHIIKDMGGRTLNEPKTIVIGNKVWIGNRCTILKGAIILDNTVVGSNSLVSKKLDQENAVYVGNPVRRVKENIQWDID